MRNDSCAVALHQLDEVAAVRLVLGPVADYPRLEYPMKAVRRAGVRLADVIEWREEDREEIYETFQIAHSWRDSHVYPMRSVRQLILSRMRGVKVKGFTAARAKRLASIRKKMRRLPTLKLDQINDLAGVRAVVDDIAGVWRLVESINQRFPHEIRQPYDYITNMKDDGYRSYHVVFVFHADNDDSAFHGRRVELQIRTRLQHSWATAVEAVGLFRKEDMKAGEGNADWLRLFRLMSEEFALSERCDGPKVGDRSARLAEIIRLNKDLNAIQILEDVRNATKYVQDYVDPAGATYFLIEYNEVDRTVKVKSYSDAFSGTSGLDDVERKIETGNSRTKVVLVEVDEIRSLAEAYPNYFGDVSLFVSNLRKICEGQLAAEYSMAPQEVVKPKPKEQPDYSWLYQRGLWAKRIRR